MWQYEYRAEASVAADVVWKLWADVEGWVSWDTSLAKADIDGPFAVGAVISMTPVDDDVVRVRIAEVVEGELFVDEADFGDITVRTSHRVERLDRERAVIVYRTEITGPGADTAGPEIGPAITGDFPDKVSALIALAEADGQRAG
jgi:hypothetical protein